MISQKRSSWLPTLAFGLVAAATPANPATAATENTGKGRSVGLAPLADREQAARSYFTDRPLLTQDGQTVRFYTDLLKDKVVLIQFIYTQCKESCPLITKQMADTQQVLGNRMGKDIYFLSLTVDPEQDTPERMKEYSHQFKTGKGWLFLTGRKEDVDAVTHKLGQTSAVVEGHSPIFILGNVRTAHWMKMQPFSTPSHIAEQLLKLAEESGSP